MSPISALWLFGAAGVSELPRALHKHALDIPLSAPGLFVLSAALGFAVNIATFLVIKTANSVTLKVLGTARTRRAAHRAAAKRGDERRAAVSVAVASAACLVADG